MDNQRLLVAKSEWLYHRSYAKKNYMNPDGTATSRAFKLREKDNGELSVDVKSMTTAKASIVDVSIFMLFEIANQDVLDMGLSTYHDPCTLEIHGYDNPAHAIIVGMDINDDIMPGLLARRSRRVYF